MWLSLEISYIICKKNVSRAVDAEWYLLLFHFAHLQFLGRIYLYFLLCELSVPPLNICFYISEIYQINSRESWR